MKLQRKRAVSGPEEVAMGSGRCSHGSDILITPQTKESQQQVLSNEGHIMAALELAEAEAEANAEADAEQA